MTAPWDLVSYRSKRYLENLLGLGVIVVMALIFFVYVNRLEMSAERAAVQQTVSILRQGVQVFMFSKMIEGGRHDFARHGDGNPFVMLSQMPEHYAGEYSAQDGMRVPDGRWYFDLDNRQAVYRYMHRPWWGGETGGREIRLSLRYAPAPGNPLPLKLMQAEADKAPAKETGQN